MLKMALCDCAIGEKCCSVYGGRGHLPSFFVPIPGDLTAQEIHHREFAILGKKNANARETGAGYSWN